MDGGVISLMEIVIEKVFPLAFMPVDKNDKEAPWDEAEEALRADRYRQRYEAETMRMSEQIRTRVEPIADLAQLLASFAENAACDSMSTPPDDLEADFDAILEASDQRKAIRALSDSHLVHLASYAHRRIEVETSEAQAEGYDTIGKLVPPRQVRDFRMVRISDAREGRKEAYRLGMLNIWDARGVEVQEGKRYRVSNLVPKRSGDWTSRSTRSSGAGGKKEIYLSTRRDTRWQPL